MVAAEVFRILRRKESALMMAEPPGKQGRTGILEIHNGVFIAVENTVFERVRGFVRHSGVHKLSVRMDALTVKAGKDRGRGCSIEAFIVKTKANLHFCLPSHRRPRAIKESQ